MINTGIDVNCSTGDSREIFSMNFVMLMLRCAEGRREKARERRGEALDAQYVIVWSSI